MSIIDTLLDRLYCLDRELVMKILENNEVLISSLMRSVVKG